MKALDAVTDKIYDDRLAAVVAEQELQYSRLHDRAVQNLVEGKAQTYPGECHGENDAAALESVITPCSTPAQVISQK